MKILNAQYEFILLMLAILSATALGVLSSIYPMMSVLGACALIGLVFGMNEVFKWKTPVWLIFFVLGLGAFPTALNLGPVRLNGALTIAVALFVFAFFLFNLGKSLTFTRLEAWSTIFLVWAVFVTLGNWQLGMSAIQNLLVLTVFFLLIAITRDHLSTGIIGYKQVQTGLAITAVTSSLLYWVPRLVLGSGGVEVHPRAFALVALVYICWFAAQGDRFWSLNGLLTVSLLASIGFSLSRTALAAGLIAIILSRFKWGSFRSILGVGFVGGLGLLASNYAINNVEVLRSRFFEGDMSLSVGGVAINGMGRSRLWEATQESATQSVSSFLFGQGAGSASQLIESIAPGLGHPHNDYLRLIHDFGLVGLILWGVLWFILLGSAIARWRFASRAGGRELANGAKAAVLVLIALLVVMITDNAIIYSFFMFPAAVVLGVGLCSIPATVDGGKVTRTSRKTIGLSLH